MTATVHAWLRWCSTCEPVPDWAKPWVLGAAIAIFGVTLLWAAWTIRRRR